MQSGYGAYQKAAKHTEAPRQIEYRLLGQVNAALLDGQKAQPDRRKMVEALLWNKQVWDHFMMDLLDTDNNLPKPTRASLTQLGVWMNKEVTKELSNTHTDPAAIIEINQIIMKGLAGQAENAGQPAAGNMGAGGAENAAGSPQPAPQQRPAGPYGAQPTPGQKRYSSDA
ncbi:MAG: flagellar biosynthesis regulator FlaF [Alphaproteobacteria bacterium]|nr:flagellar biosynthesis regulator FlaF [Alphaproteobacteria bacterium]